MLFILSSNCTCEAGGANLIYLMKNKTEAQNFEKFSPRSRSLVPHPVKEHVMKIQVYLVSWVVLLTSRSCIQYRCSVVYTVFWLYSSTAAGHSVLCDLYAVLYYTSLLVFGHQNSSVKSILFQTMYLYLALT